MGQRRRVMDGALGDGLLIGAHKVGECTQKVGEEGEGLDLRGHEVGAGERVARAGPRRAQGERLDHHWDQ